MPRRFQPCILAVSLRTRHPHGVEPTTSHSPFTLSKVNAFAPASLKDTGRILTPSVHDYGEVIL